jgi:hypothetical protein
VIPSAQIHSATGFTVGFAGDFAALADGEEVLLKLVGCGRFAGSFDGVFEAGDDCACECDANHATLRTLNNKTQMYLILRLLTTAHPSLSVSKFRSHMGDVAKKFHSVQEEWSIFPLASRLEELK